MSLYRFVDATNNATKRAVGFLRNSKTLGLSPDIEKLCQERRNLHSILIANPTDPKIREDYNVANRKVKNEVQKHKQNMLNQTIISLENDYHYNNSHNLFKKVK